MMVTVRFHDGKVSQYLVYPKDTVASLNFQIQWSMGIPPRIQRLLYRGKQLSGHIGDYGISDGDVIHHICGFGYDYYTH